MTSTNRNAVEGAAHYTRIVPTRGWIGIRFGELWDYRELLFFLAWRDVKVRYKQTVLGVAWAFRAGFFDRPEDKGRGDGELETESQMAAADRRRPQK